ncbi:MAG: sugar ABC transporter permease [Solirubrobacteraceae bacterium]|jgi:ABC-type sugar transport system permease subunit
MQTSDPPLAQLTASAVAPPSRARRRDGRAAALFIGPNLLLFTIFVAIPIVGGLLLSFTNWDLTGLPQWAGLANYRAMFADPLVGMAVVTTLKFLVLGVVPTVVISLALAMLINVRFRFVAVVRTLYLIPAAVSFAASALIWQFIFRPGQQGLLDYLLSLVGISGPGWLSSTTWAVPALDIITIWLALPTATVLYLAALQRIPESVIEAAMLDGAGPLRRVRYVIWPGVRYMTVLVAIVALLAFTNGSFDLVNILTRGQPIYATQTLIYYIYYTAFTNGEFGYAAALSVLQIALVGGLLGGLRLLTTLVSR